VNRTLKMCLLTALVAAAMILAYRIVFIRTVNYEIAGIKIPSKYNALTGKVTPIINYAGRAIKNTVEERKIDLTGMSGNQVTLAQFRWALFEQWVRTKPLYKGWETDPELFRKANEDFRKSLEASGARVTVIE